MVVSYDKGGLLCEPGGELDHDFGEGQTVHLCVFGNLQVCSEGDTVWEPHAGAEGGDQVVAFSRQGVQGLGEVVRRARPAGVASQGDGRAVYATDSV